MSSLCYKPALYQPSLPAPHTYTRQPPSLGSSISAVSLSRNPSTSSTCTTNSLADNNEDWEGSHYRRLARAEARHEERRAERRRRRAEGSIASSTLSRTTTMSSSSSASRGLPDLIGGGGHSRNPSTASSVGSSLSGWGASLSRNASSASNASASSRRGYGGTHLDTAIMEDDDEEEWLTSEERPRHHIHGSAPYATPSRPRGKNQPKNKQLDNLGMGKDMRDVLEQILQMEQEFTVEGEEEDAQPGLFTAAFSRVPKTPPHNEVRRKSIAPGAPARGHRASLSQPIKFKLEAAAPQIRQPRPPSLMGLHQASLSESHTALYLATASPAKNTAGRRSASPQLQARRSIAFNPDSIGPLPLPNARFDSPANAITPSRRRMNGNHPPMDQWRFPGSNTATPTRPNQVKSGGGVNPYDTPVHQSTLRSSSSSGTQMEEQSTARPQLLWPLTRPPLAPSLFPSSPATATPDFPSSSSLSLSTGITEANVVAPTSGLRLGVLLGSGSGDDGMDIDDEDEGSTEQGHGGLEEIDRQYLPVFLEAEGFQQRRW